MVAASVRRAGTRSEAPPGVLVEEVPAGPAGSGAGGWRPRGRRPLAGLRGRELRGRLDPDEGRRRAAQRENGGRRGDEVVREAGEARVVIKDLRGFDPGAAGVLGDASNEDQA